MQLDPNQRYLQQRPSGHIYVWTPELAQREDMYIVRDGDPQPALTEEVEPVDLGPIGEEVGADADPIFPKDNGRSGLPAHNRPPENDSDRVIRLREAIARLDPQNKEHYTQGGKPRVSALEQMVGFDITPAERDAALG